MAKMLNNLYGFPSGKIGNIVFCIRNGKPYFYLLNPGKRIVRSEKLKAVNYRFRVSAAFNSAITRLKIIRELWKNYPINAYSTFNKMSGVNITRVKQDYDISDMQLLPHNEKFETSITNVQSGSGIISVTASPYEGIVCGSKLVSVQGVMQLRDPSDNKIKPCAFIPVHSRDIDLVNSMPFQFEIRLSNQDEEIIKLYNRQNFLLNIIIKDTQGQPEKFSREVYV